MNLKTYHAYTMSEALAAVKHDLGADAVILNTRTFKRGGVLGLGKKTIVEVTATPAQVQTIRNNTASEPLSKLKVNGHAAQRAYGNRAGGTATMNPADRSLLAASDAELLREDQRRTKRLAMALEEAHKRSNAQHKLAASTVPASKASSVTPAKAEPKAVHAAPAAAPVRIASSPTLVHPTLQQQVTAPVVSLASAARRFLLTTPDKPASGSTKHVIEEIALPVAATTTLSVPTPSKSMAAPPPASAAVVPNPVDAATPPAHHAMHDELSAIKAMVGQVLQRQVGPSGQAKPSMPKHLFEMYLKLIEQDVSDELADQIVNDVRNELHGEQLESETIVRAAVLRHLSAIVPIAANAVPEHAEDGRPLSIALIGPTGVGKTTTLAKLAASFKLRHNKKVGLITSDTYRIAAVDQLRTYANIIGLPLQVAMSPAEMKQAVYALRDCDVILIDTAGRSQNDTGRIEELRQFIAAANPHEVHLVLSSTAGEKVLLREAEAFAEVGMHKVVLTKLDEAVSFGMLINVIRKVGKQLSFVTTGQEVPTHLEVGRGERLAELVLGGSIRA